MDYIRPQKLSRNFIRSKAEEFRQEFVNPPEIIPVPIIDIVELKLRITPIPIPNMQKSIDVDAFLSNDLKSIYVDQDMYFDDRYLNRLRFTFAHEVGHFVLHAKEIQQCQFRTEDDWLNFREDMQEEDLFFFEQQAYEFAGRLLVPINALKRSIQNQKDKIEHYRSVIGDENNDLLMGAISRVICTEFKVSDGVILRRLQKEDINF
ncbi:MAG: ImmA/IrrE family metallo-endopeptidase [Calditrichaceae bacterium]